MDVTFEQAIKEANTALPARKLVALIERTNLSADMKAFLSDIARVTIKIGQKIILIGRKILTVVFDLINSFPAVALGVVSALAITAQLGLVSTQKSECTKCQD